MPQLSCHSPVGDITIHEWDGAIVSLDWGWGSLQEPSPLLKEAKCQLEAYFDGDLKTFDLPLAPGGTSFFTRLWRRLMDIPYGEVVTYGRLAAELGSHARAVGMACARNPIPILIPCHRVVARDGRLAGYSGDGGLETKAFLLRLEGAGEAEDLRLPL
ncbi:MAG TPA: methylated-DNA--[protein]-cysteine S-methyltransferase, partial [Sphingomonadales bacterium]